MHEAYARMVYVELTVEVFQKILKTAILQAIDGDRDARRWLTTWITDYLPEYDPLTQGTPRNWEQQLEKWVYDPNQPIDRRMRAAAELGKIALSRSHAGEASSREAEAYYRDAQDRFDEEGLNDPAPGGNGASCN